MRTWRAKASDFLGRWESARYRARQDRQDLRDRREADELQRAWAGVDRFPVG